MTIEKPGAGKKGTTVETVAKAVVPKKKSKVAESKAATTTTTTTTTKGPKAKADKSLGAVKPEKAKKKQKDLEPAATKEAKKKQKDVEPAAPKEAKAAKEDKATKFLVSMKKSVRKALKKEAAELGISMNEFIVSAVAAKLGPNSPEPAPKAAKK
jgi:predicted HicB family RNase H-like nuclease